MSEPQRLTEKQILDRINFHEAGVDHYQRKESTYMAKWSMEQVVILRKALAALNNPAGDTQ